MFTVFLYSAKIIRSQTTVKITVFGPPQYSCTTG